MLALPIGVLVALVSSAAPSSNEAIAIHPIAVVGADPGEARALNAPFHQAVSDAGFALAPSEPVHRFIEALPDKSCGGEDECLAKLATAAAAESAMLITVSVGREKLTVSGRMVRKDGHVVSKVAPKEIKRAPGPFSDAVIGAVKQVLPELKEVDPVDIAPLVTNDPVVTPAVPAAATPRPAVGSPLKTVGLVAAGVGVVSMAVGGVVAMLAASDAERARNGMDADGRYYKSETAALNGTLRGRGQVANATLVGGAVLAAAGATLFFMAPAPKAGAVLAVAPIAAGVSVTFSQRF